MTEQTIPAHRDPRRMTDRAGAIPDPGDYADLSVALAKATCRHCGHVGIRVEWRWEAKPLGTFSLAGMQTKVSATRWPYAICNGCGHESRGERD